jgi:hypothetical protein
MNFAAQLATAARVALRDAARPFNATPEALVDHAFDTLSMPRPTAAAYAAVVNYVRSGGAWTGSDAQLLTKTAGVFHLLTASGEFQFV